MALEMEYFETPCGTPLMSFTSTSGCINIPESSIVIGTCVDGDVGPGLVHCHGDALWPGLRRQGLQGPGGCPPESAAGVLGRVYPSGTALEPERGAHGGGRTGPGYCSSCSKVSVQATHART